MSDTFVDVGGVEVNEADLLTDPRAEGWNVEGTPERTENPEAKSPPPKSVADQIGDEWAEQEKNHDGWLPSAPPAEGEPDEFDIETLNEGQVAGMVFSDSERADFEAAVESNPGAVEELIADGLMVAEPKTNQELFDNLQALKTHFPAIEEAGREARQVVDRAFDLYASGEIDDPGRFADAIAEHYGEDTAREFVQRWKQDEEGELLLDPDEWLEEQDARFEEAAIEEDTAEFSERFGAGLDRYLGGLSPKEREQMAPVLGDFALGFLQGGGDAGEFGETPEEVERFLRNSAGNIKQLAEAARIAEFRAGEDANDRTAALEAGWLDAVDQRKSYDEHFADEVQKRIADGRVDADALSAAAAAHIVPRPSWAERIEQATDIGLSESQKEAQRSFDALQSVPKRTRRRRRRRG